MLSLVLVGVYIVPLLSHSLHLLSHTLSNNHSLHYCPAVMGDISTMNTSSSHTLESWWDVVSVELVLPPKCLFCVFDQMYWTRQTRGSAGSISHIWLSLAAGQYRHGFCCWRSLRSFSGWSIFFIFRQWKLFISPAGLYSFWAHLKWKHQLCIILFTAVTEYKHVTMKKKKRFPECLEQKCYITMNTTISLHLRAFISSTFSWKLLKRGSFTHPKGLHSGEC